MSKDTNPALAEHSVPDAPAAPVSQAVQTIPPTQAAVQIPNLHLRLRKPDIIFCSI